MSSTCEPSPRIRKPLKSVTYKRNICYTTLCPVLHWEQTHPISIDEQAILSAANTILRFPHSNYTSLATDNNISCPPRAYLRGPTGP